MSAHRLPRATGLLLLAGLLLLLAIAVPAMARHGAIGDTVTAVDDAEVFFKFVPDDPTIKAGENVLFVNNSAAPHTLSAGPPGGRFDSGLVLPGGERIVSTEHLQPGEYPFFCRVHPFMTGTLTVEAP